jgi:large subunit ribosomal protein L4
MELEVADGKGIEVADAAFARPYNGPLVHQAVETYRAGGRAGTAAQKTRSEVSGGSSKPWRQKGTGRARAGTMRSPIWRHGGQHFPQKPRDHAKGLNRKMYRGALRSIFSELVRQQRLVVVHELTLPEPKTRHMATRLDELGGSDTLIVLARSDRNVELGARNLPHAEVAGVNGVNPVNLLRHERVVITVDALKQVEEWLA